MKHSKLFMTVSSFVLAIAGVVSFKSVTPFATGYYIQTSVKTNNCVYVGVSTTCSYLQDVFCSTAGGRAMFLTVTIFNRQKCLFG